MNKGLTLLLLLTVAWLASASAAPLQGEVSWIYDGDTIEVEQLGKVRLIGIDAPEKEDSERDVYYLRQGVSRPALRRVARQSLQFLIDNVKGRHVTLETEAEERDRHGRLLAYVYLPDGSLLNELLLEKGYAAVYRRFDFRLKEVFLKAEESARNNAEGLWAKPPRPPMPGSLPVNRY